MNTTQIQHRMVRAPACKPDLDTIQTLLNISPIKRKKKIKIVSYIVKPEPH